MLKQIYYIKPFLMLIDDDEGHDIVRINVHQIIDIELNQHTLSILVRDDIEYTYMFEI